LRYASGSPRAFSPRDDKSGIYHEGREKVAVTSCHCEEVTKLATRQSIVSRSKSTDMLFISVMQVDRHGLSALAMTRVVFTMKRVKRLRFLIVIKRRERSWRRGDPSWLEQSVRICCSFPLCQWTATGFQPSR